MIPLPAANAFTGMGHYGALRRDAELADSVRAPVPDRARPVPRTRDPGAGRDARDVRRDPVTPLGGGVAGQRASPSFPSWLAPPGPHRVGREMPVYLRRERGIRAAAIPVTRPGPDLTGTGLRPCRRCRAGRTGLAPGEHDDVRAQRPGRNRRRAAILVTWFSTATRAGLAS